MVMKLFLKSYERAVGSYHVQLFFVIRKCGTIFRVFMCILCEMFCHVKSLVLAAADGGPSGSNVALLTGK